jgi:multidrug efflux pump
MGGMIAVVILALLMVPVLFVSVMRFFGREKEGKAKSVAADHPYGPPARVQHGISLNLHD